MFKKLKSFLLNDHIFFGLIVVLVGIASFGLGRASVASEIETTPKFGFLDTKAPALQETNLLEATQVLPVSASGVLPEEELVASKSGTKYHLVSCGGAKQIKPENRIYFSSRAAAQAAGYKPAANCPGLQ